MVAVSHGANSVQGGQEWLRSNQWWFGSHLMREEGRNHKNKRMEMRDCSAGLVNSRNDVTRGMCQRNAQALPQRGMKDLK